MVAAFPVLCRYHHRHVFSSFFRLRVEQTFASTDVLSRPHLLQNSCQAELRCQGYFPQFVSWSSALEPSPPQRQHLLHGEDTEQLDYHHVPATGSIVLGTVPATRPGLQASWRSIRRVSGTDVASSTFSPRRSTIAYNANSSMLLHCGRGSPAKLKHRSFAPWSRKHVANPSPRK